MVKTKEAVDEHKPHQERQAGTSKEHKDDEAVDEEESNENDESSEDSILEEARQFASQGSKTIPAKWMKSEVKKINKDLKQQKKAENEAKKAARKAAKATTIANAKRNSGKKPGKEPSTSIPVKKAIAKDRSKSSQGSTSSKGQEDVKPKPMHDLTAVITYTVLRQSHKHNPRTYMQGRTAEMEPGQRLILITEITEKKSPHHWELMQEVP